MTIVTPLILSLIKSRSGRQSLALRTGLSLLFIIDLAFLFANLTKLEDGGWLPLASGLIIYWLMQSWQTGRASMMGRLLREQKPVRDFLEDLKRDPPVRVPGTAVFLDCLLYTSILVLDHHLDRAADDVVEDVRQIAGVNDHGLGRDGPDPAIAQKAIDRRNVA